MNHSEIAKSGYANEQWLAETLANYQNNMTSRQIINALGHENITNVYSVRSKNTGKVDVYATIYKEDGNFSMETFSCKKMSTETTNGFGHVCRSTLDSYTSKFGLNHLVRESLGVYSGAFPVNGLRGLYFDNKYFDTTKKQEIIDFFTQNYDKVIETIFLGTSEGPRWFTVTAESDDSKILFLTEMKNVLEYAKGDRRVWFGRNAKKQNLILGNVSMYRKNGELQFKMYYKAMVKELKNKMRIFYF